MKTPSHVIGRTLLAIALGIALLVGSRGIANEGAVSTQGDMPRYLMNGAFLTDFAASGGQWTFRGCIDYARLYFAKYPALSLGHHPPLLSISLVPFYAVFGVSVLSARLAVLTFFLWSVWLIYQLGKRQYGSEAGGWASLIFATTPFLLPYGQVVMSEMPTVATVLLTMNLLYRFTETGRAWDYVLFVAAAVASLSAKQLAVFVFPVYAGVLATDGRWRLLVRRNILILTGIGLAGVALVAVATLVYSPLNADLVLWLLRQWQGFPWAWSVGAEILAAHLSPGIAAAIFAAIAVAIWQRDNRIVLSVAWMLSVVVFTVVLVGAVEPRRYAILAIPAYALCAASLSANVRRPNGKRAVVLLLAGVAVSNLWIARHIRPTGAEGYEAAARYVIDHKGGPTVLFSGAVDTGYFIFFMRKHDPEGHFVVLRADKLLTTSLMGDVAIEDRIGSPDEIYPPLNAYGTKYVVLEDRPTGSKVIDWLRTELKTDRFIERQRIPIVSDDWRLRGVSLVVYEYKDARPADPNAKVFLKLPLVDREILTTLSDLVDVPPAP